jgi:hypothetical protein
MSTQTTFDVDGLRRAVAARNEDYLLALYADRAEVEFIDPDHPEAPLQVLRGKSAIQEWLHDMSSPDVRYQVWNSAAGRESLRFTEECSYPDGTHLRYECRAEVRSGQITRARMAVVCPSAVKPAGDAGDQPGHPVDEDPPRTPPRRPRPPSPPGMFRRSIPGNFFG